MKATSYASPAKSTRVKPSQPYAENVRRTPIEHARTVRADDVSAVTSSTAGKFCPIAMIPLLREDGVMSSQLNINFQMAQTAEMLLNPVRATAVAYLVPKLALDRFLDQGTIDRSYNGQPEIDASVVPWFKPFAGTLDNPIVEKLGLHYSAEGYNDEYIEAYNQVWNFIAIQRSPALTLRGILETTIAPAFWEHNQMKHVKPTFDDAMLEGVVPIDFVGGFNQLPINRVDGSPGVVYHRADNDNVVGSGTNQFNADGTLGTSTGNPTNFDPMGSIVAELQADSVQLTLANISLARQTAAWARMRTEFQGLDEDWMMDQLLSGIRISYEGLKHPILLDHKDTVFGMSQRYATDSANLDKSATNGQTSVTFEINVLQLTTGGTIVVCAQCLPEQIFERQRDYYFQADSVVDLPSRTSDELDPQPVALVKNDEVDCLHTLSNDLFGYAPLNHEWQRNAPRLGGRYYRSDPLAPWTEERNRIWDTSVVDPQLGTDFYVASTIDQNVFIDIVSDTFEYWIGGRVNISGLIYFGPMLREATDDYDKVLAQVDTSRVSGDGTDVPAAAAADAGTKS